MTLILLSIGYVSIAAPAAAISLSTEPGAAVAIKPTENEFISWVITPSAGKLPVRTELIIVNQDGDVVEQAVYYGSDGLQKDYTYTLPATYTVPAGLPFEKYVVQLDYYSSIGWEAQAKAAFFVSQDTGSLKIIKFNDLNLNGQLDAGEPPVSDVYFRIQFPEPFQSTIFVTQTDSNGEIFYEQLGTGSYTVTEIVPAGSIPTTPEQQIAVLQKDQTTTQYYGNAAPPGGIKIEKFYDHNGNGQRDPEDGPLENVHFEASAPCGQQSSGDTDANGEIYWPDRCIGDWVITETAPANFAPTRPSVVTRTVSSGVTQTVVFGNQGTGALSPHVFWDIDGNGVQDSGEPDQEGYTVSYQNEYNETDSAQTDSQGNILWPSVREGAYTTTLQLANGCVATTANPVTDTVQYLQTTYVTYGYRCMLYLPIVLRDWPEPTPTPTVTPTPTPTPTVTPTPPPALMPVVHPKGIGVDANTNTLYVASRSENNVYVLDAATNAQITKIDVGQTPYGVAVDAEAKRAYVANADSGTLSVIDTDSNSVIATIDLGAHTQPVQVAVNPDTKKVYVTLHSSSQLAVIDANTNTLSKVVSDLPGAFDVVVNQNDNQVYVSARDGHYVSILSGDTDSQVTRLNPGGETYAMAYDPVIKQLYLIIDPDGPLYLLDLPADSIYLPLPNIIQQQDPNPNAIIVFEVKPNYDFGRRGYVLAGKAGADGGVGIAADPSTGNFFVSNAADNTLSVFDGPYMITHATLNMKGNPGDVAVNPVTKRVYVSNRSANVVQMIVDGW